MTTNCQLHFDFGESIEEIREEDAKCTQRIDEELHSKDKRNNGIEKAQKAYIKNICMQLNHKYNDCGVYIDITRLGKEGEIYYLTDNGKATAPSDLVKLKKRKGTKKNNYYSSKTFDGYLTISIKGIEYIFFFILKGCENPGGHQDNVKQEIGCTTRLIDKFEGEDNIYFVFVLDGSNFSDSDKICSSNKYKVITSEGVKDTLEGFIISKI